MRVRSGSWISETLTGHEHDLARRHLLEVPLELLRGPLVEKEAVSAEGQKLPGKLLVLMLRQQFWLLLLAWDR